MKRVSQRLQASCGQCSPTDIMADELGGVGSMRRSFESPQGRDGGVSGPCLAAVALENPCAPAFRAGSGRASLLVKRS
jgi:hypothetical protein